MLLMNSCGPGHPSCRRFDGNPQLAGFTGYGPGPKNAPVKGCKSYFHYFPPFGLFGVHLGSVPKLSSTEFFGDAAQATLDVVTVELERLAISFYAAHSDVDVRVLRVVMRNGDPFDIGIEILRNAQHQLAREPWQVGAVPKLGGDD
jgi:hypothetical protein